MTDPVERMVQELSRAKFQVIFAGRVWFYAWRISLLGAAPFAGALLGGLMVKFIIWLAGTDAEPKLVAGVAAVSAVVVVIVEGIGATEMDWRGKSK